MITTIISDSLVVSETQRTSVTNRLTIILPKSNPGRITTLADLARPGLKLDNVKSVVSKVQLGEADAGIV
jgi:ABC-type molybdate transport system substrate-binding protein